jgi:hypothetical protein
MTPANVESGIRNMELCGMVPRFAGGLAVEWV